jgi:hypothetical protein
MKPTALTIVCAKNHSVIEEKAVVSPFVFVGVPTAPYSDVV